jgi:hypothetical protein
MEDRTLFLDIRSWLDDRLEKLLSRELEFVMLWVSFRALEIRSCIVDFRFSLKPDDMEEINESD